MKIWFDTEFIEDGHTIELISIGMIREDGQTLYREFHFNEDSASDWVRQNVFPYLAGDRCDRYEIRREIMEFAGPTPEFWAYYADYDWVALCQLYGTMMDLPKGWPMYCRDVEQFRANMGGPDLPKQVSTEHHALNDAKWTKTAWEFLQSYPQRRRAGDLPPGVHQL